MVLDILHGGKYNRPREIFRIYKLKGMQRRGQKQFVGTVRAGGRKGLMDWE